MDSRTTEMAAKYLANKGKLELWSGVIGNRTLDNAAKEQAKSIAAENAAARRAAGWIEPATGDDMENQTVLGDVVTTTTRSGLGLREIALMGAIAVGTGGIGLAALPFVLDYLKPKPVETQPPVEAKTFYPNEYTFGLGKGG